MRTFTCSLCGLTFDSERDEAEVQSEYEQNFGPMATEDKESLCDDCYNEVMAAYPPHQAVQDHIAGREPDEETKQRIANVMAEFKALEEAGALPSIYDMLRLVPWGNTTGWRLLRSK